MFGGLWCSVVNSYLVLGDVHIILYVPEDGGLYVVPAITKRSSSREECGALTLTALDQIQNLLMLFAVHLPANVTLLKIKKLHLVN